MHPDASLIVALLNGASLLSRITLGPAPTGSAHSRSPCCARSGTLVLWDVVVGARGEVVGLAYVPGAFTGGWTSVMSTVSSKSPKVISNSISSSYFITLATTPPERCITAEQDHARPVLRPVQPIRARHAVRVRDIRTVGCRRVRLASPFSVLLVFGLAYGAFTGGWTASWSASFGLC